MELVLPPHRFDRAPRPWLFLAGSIEMGTADRWQDRFYDLVADRAGTILNPRRADWDASWKQRADEPQFREQVVWELATSTWCVSDTACRWRRASGSW